MAQDFDTSGIWRSTYHYTNGSTKQRQTAQHDVQLFRTGHEIVIQSLPTDSGSYLFLRLVLDGRLLTGTWHEYTAPSGDYQGATYYGGIQLQLSDDDNTLRGKWLGFGRSGKVNIDDWEFVRTDQ